MALGCGGAPQHSTKPRIVSSRVMPSSATTTGEVTSTKQGATIELRQKHTCEIVRETPFASGGWIRRKLHAPCKQQPLAGAAVVLQVGKREIALGKTNAAGTLTIRWRELRPKLGNAAARFGSVVIASTSQTIGTLGIALPSAGKQPAVADKPRPRPRPEPKRDRAALTAQANTAIALARHLRPGFANALLSASDALVRNAPHAPWARALGKRVATARLRAAKRATARGRRLRRRHKLHSAFVLLTSAQALAPTLRRVTRELRKLTPHLRRFTLGFVSADIDSKQVTVATYLPRRRKQTLRLGYACKTSGLLKGGGEELDVSPGVRLNRSSLGYLGPPPPQCQLTISVLVRGKPARKLVTSCAVRNAPLRPGECK